MAITAMNTIARNAFKALSYTGSKTRGFTKRAVLMREQQYTDGLTRSLWVLCGNGTHQQSHKILKGEWSTTCGCGCSTAGSLHTKGDKELVEFLDEEIKAEVKSQKQPGLPKIEGFSVKTDGGDVTLTRNFNNETITIKLNVNHSVDTEEPTQMQADENQKEPEFGEMKSKPSFTVDIAKGGKGLSISCNFTSEDTLPEEESQDSYNDVFQISELSLYEGEMKDATYAVSGEIMDGYLYDLLMNMLEDRGVSNDFVEKLTEFCTVYEHQQYIGLLKGLKSFISEK